QFGVLERLLDGVIVADAGGDTDQQGDGRRQPMDPGPPRLQREQADQQQQQGEGARQGAGQRRQETAGIDQVGIGERIPRQQREAQAGNGQHGRQQGRALQPEGQKVQNEKDRNGQPGGDQAGRIQPAAEGRQQHEHQVAQPE